MIKENKGLHSFLKLGPYSNTHFYKESWDYIRENTSKLVEVSFTSSCVILRVASRTCPCRVDWVTPDRRLRNLPIKFSIKISFID